MNQRIVCFILARGNSKGIPKKNLIPLAGHPLVSWSVKQAVNSKYVSECYVSSDSDEILAVAEKYGAKKIKRPDDISGDTASSESALLHAYNEVLKQDPRPVDLIVFLQPTSPVRKKDDIDRAVTTLQNEKADSLLSVRPLLDYFIWKKTPQTAEATNFDYKNRKRRQEIEPTYLENGSIYVFKPEILLKNNNRLGGKIALHAMEPSCSFQIDDPADLGICEYYLNKMETT